MMALVLSGFALIPSMETKHPGTLPLMTPNTHFSGLSLSPTSRILVQFSSRSKM
jgi:hypothetical protein